MSQVTNTFHNLRCDRCGTLCDAQMWHDTPDTLDVVAAEQDWQQIGDKHYCPDCWEYDDDDNVIIKPKKAMTRQQQISDAAQMCDLCGNRHDLDCFAEGAAWADSHPQQVWHKYPEEKPTEEGEYYVACKDGEYTLDKYIILKGIEGEFWRMQNHCFCDDNNVKFWMEKPHPPKFD